MIRLFFKNGVTSPVFKVRGEVYDGFRTSYIKEKDNNIKKVILNVADNRTVEGIKFMSTNSEGKEVCLAKLAPCDCGSDETFEVPACHQIVGMFGLTATDKLVEVGGYIKYLDNINGLGFITANLIA